jgi:hypothetical protein
MCFGDKQNASKKNDDILHHPDVPTELVDIFQQIARLDAIHSVF